MQTYSPTVQQNPARFVPSAPIGPDVADQDPEVRRLLAMTLDPVRFVVSCGRRPDPWQCAFLRSPSKRRMLNCSRQIGKSTVVADGAAHKAIYYPGSLILLLSPGERQSGELMRKVYSTIERSVDAPKLLRQGILEAEFSNGSRIIALPGKEGTIRGFSAVDILVVDEASWVPNTLYMAIQPMLAVSGGELWTLSSPYGTRGWWYDEYNRIMEDRKYGKRPEWDYYEVPATMCPRISATFLAAEKRRMGEWWYMQEYFCKFMDAQNAPFGAAEIDAAFDEGVIPWGI